ncbi:MAG: UDP-N-acetylglucosamine 2-epimerase (non-hydrolyzing) [Chloroflexota bacterium]
MIKVLSVFGTRPEAVKMAPIVKEMERYPNKIDSRVCVTAQHREMLDQVLSLFEITPDYDLNLMRPNQTLSQLTANILVNLTPVIETESPDWILVQGDTTTVMAASLASFFLGVRVGHIEAGLRTGDKRQPFPEEINRRIAGVVSDLHFAPTDWAQDNLLNEGIPQSQVVKTGNTVIDALQITINKPYDPSQGPLANVPWDKRLILVTAHRRENFGEPLIEICQALKSIARAYEQDTHLIYPVHLNPNVQEPVYRLLGDVKNITLLPPLDYQPLVYLMKRVYMVITDSGGIQEEAPGFGKPVLVLRDKTERPEGVQAGTAKLVGTSQDMLISETRQLLDSQEAYEQMGKAVNPYGDGRASQRIVQTLLEAS